MLLDVSSARHTKYTPRLAETIEGVSQSAAKKIARQAYLEDLDAQELAARGQGQQSSSSSSGMTKPNEDVGM